MAYFNVISDSEDDTKYEVRYSKTKPSENSYYCSCPAWKYQVLHPKLRTCKHIKAIRGEEAEKQRIIQNGGEWPQTNIYNRKRNRDNKD